MNRISIIQYILFTLFLSAGIAGCHSHSDGNHDHDHSDHDEHMEDGAHDDHHEDHVMITQQQFEAMAMEMGNIVRRNLSDYIEANGQLEVTPQNEASVTAIIGANILQIKIIEGDKVSKGQVIAYVSHPDLIELQSDYITGLSQLEYLNEEMSRSSTLHEKGVIPLKELQKVKSEYLGAKAFVSSHEAQLKLLGLDLQQLQEGRIYEKVPVFSPINGFVSLVNVNIGQFVEPQTVMFEIINIEHIHADLMVFEKDVHKVKEGQTVMFSVESVPGKELEATIYSVGKTFEKDPKAVHLHAEIENKEGLLLSGMYVNGRILIVNKESFALPEEAVVKEDDKTFVFTAQKLEDGKYEFKLMEIFTGIHDKGWVEIKPITSIDKLKFALNNAYYLMAELKKSEAEHTH